MECAELKVSKLMKPWDVVIELGDGLPEGSWALVLKSAAYCADRRDRRRHLDDIALLASLVTDHKGCIEQLHGSDRRRLRTAAGALSDPNSSSWMRLNPEKRKAGQFTLAVLTR